MEKLQHKLTLLGNNIVHKNNSTIITGTPTEYKQIYTINSNNELKEHNINMLDSPEKTIVCNDFMILHVSQNPLIHGVYSRDDIVTLAGASSWIKGFSKKDGLSVKNSPFIDSELLIIRKVLSIGVLGPRNKFQEIAKYETGDSIDITRAIYDYAHNRYEFVIRVQRWGRVKMIIAGFDNNINMIFNEYLNS